LFLFFFCFYFFFFLFFQLFILGDFFENLKKNHKTNVEEGSELIVDKKIIEKIEELNSKKLSLLKLDCKNNKNKFGKSKTETITNLLPVEMKNKLKIKTNITTNSVLELPNCVLKVINLINNRIVHRNKEFNIKF
jgi:hypothetical protein